MADRNLNVTINLRNAAKNNSEMDKLRKAIGSLQKIMDQAGSSMGGMGAKSKVTSNAITRIREEIDKLSKSLSGMDTGKLNLSGATDKIRKNIEKIIEYVRKSNKELGGFGRDAIDGAEDLGKKFEEVVAVLNKLGDSSAKNNTSLNSLSSALNAAGSAISSFTARIIILEKEEVAAMNVTSRLEKSIRDLQAVGSMKGVPMFQQNIASVKLYQEELEKLRLRLAQAINEPFAISKSGVTEQMVLQMRKFSEEIGNAEIRIKELQNAFKNIEIIRDSMEKAIVGIRNSAAAMKDLSNETGSTRLSVRNLVNEQQNLSSESLKHLNKMIAAYRESREVIVSTLESIGMKFSDLETRPSRFAEASTKSMIRVREEINKTSATVENLEAAYIQAGGQITKSLHEILASEIGTWETSTALKREEQAITEKLSSQMADLQSDYLKIKAAVGLADAEWKNSGMVIELMNSALKKARALLKILPKEYHAVINSVIEFIQSQNQEISVLERLRSYMVAVSGQVENLVKQEQILKIATDGVTESESLLSGKLDIARQKAVLYAEAVMTLASAMFKAKTEGTMTAKELSELSVILDMAKNKASLAGAEFKETSKQMQRLQRTSADASRAMDRMSSTGFANMIVSQAAWMAGFQVIFGTLDKFKEALSSVVDTQLAVARAMRTARGETLSTLQVWSAFTDAINAARRDTGRAASDLGEIMYQLGSAGLSAEEALAALDSTLANLIGTEGDVENITNLVAGLYNNFGDQIVKLNGRVESISATFDDYNNSLVQSTSLTEKFKFINDQLVRTFDAHQAEMDQIRDGLKFMAQSARQANISLTEQLGILATLHDHLIKAGAAGRGMRVILSRITKDAGSFAKAFDIKIDLSQPLNFIQILEDIHKKIKTNAISVEELGVIFQRMGLRGAEPFLVLTRNFEELIKNIKDLRENANDAAETMKKIRLSNFGDQAEIAKSKVEGFLKTGLNPFVETAGKAVGIFNTLVKMIEAINKVFGGLFGTLVKISGYVAVIVAISFAMKNFGTIVLWMRGMFSSLIATMSKFGAEALKNDAETKKLDISFQKLSTSARSLWMNLKLATSAMYQHHIETEKMGRSMAVLATTGDAVTTAWKSLGAVMKSVIFIAAFEIIYRLIDAIVTWDQRMKEAIETQKKQVDKVQESITKLEKLRNSLYEASTEVRNWKDIQRQMNEQFGVTIGNVRTQEEMITRLSVSFERLLDVQRQIKEIEAINLISKQLDQMESSAKAMIITNEVLSKQFIVFGDKVKLLGDKIVSADRTLATLRGNLTVLDDFLKNKFLPPNVREKIEALKIEWTKIVDEISKGLPGMINSRNALFGISEVSEKVRMKIKDTRGEFSEFNKAMATMADAIENKGLKILMDFSDGIYSLNDYLMDLESRLQAGTGGFIGLSEAMDKLAREDKLKDLKDDLASLQGRLTKLGQMGTENILILLQDFSKLKDGITVFSKEIIKELSSVEISIRKMDEEINKVSLEKLSEQSKISSEQLRILDDRLKIIREKLEKVRKSGETTSGMTSKFATTMSQYNDVLGENAMAISSVTDATEKKQRMTSKEKKNYEEQIAIMQKEIKSMKDRDIIYNKQIEDSKKGIDLSNKSVEGLEKVTGAYGKEIESRKKLIDSAKEQYESEKKILEMQREMHKITGEDYYRKIKELQDKYSKSIQDMSRGLEPIYEKQRKAQEDLRTQYEANRLKLIETLSDVKKSLDDLVAAMSQIKLEIDTTPAFAAFNEFIGKLDDWFREKKNNPYVIYWKYQEAPGSKKPQSPAKDYSGGPVKRAGGGFIPSLVTAGEGYIPPGEAMKNLNLLNTLNGGRTSSRVPHSISKFTGPGGIDNIPALLPTGSYVMSKKGMEAWDRSLQRGAATYQSGGEVSSTDQGIEFTPPRKVENIGSFTIVVQKGETSKSFPVMGDPSVLRSLKKELERESLTRLH